ncbi:hypothetical protein EDB86DRAFT_3072838 [Lactarius hatsudake]|nr:hypothetical protein EDB86DRAFT_3072838 [Lactarius hatsudake]
MRKRPGRTTLDRWPDGHDLKKDPCACLDQLKVKIKDDTSFLTSEQRTAIVDHGNPGSCQGTSAAGPPCANDDVLDGLLATLDADEFGRLTGLADDMGRFASKSGADCLANKENAED